MLILLCITYNDKMIAVKRVIVRYFEGKEIWGQLSQTPMATCLINVYSWPSEDRVNKHVTFIGDQLAYTAHG